MTIRDRLSGVTASYPTVEVSDELAESLDAGDREVLMVRPFRETAGHEAGVRFVGDFFCDPSVRRSKNPVWSFEAWFTNGRVEFAVTCPTGRETDVRDAVTSKYPNSIVTPSRDILPPVSAGDVVAGARLTPSHDSLFPFVTRKSADPLDFDPHQSLLPKLVGADDERTVFQVIFQSVGQKWYKRGPVGATGDSVGDALRQGTSVGHLNPRVVTADHLRRASKDIQRQAGRDAFRVSIRVLSVASTREAASNRVEAVVGNLNHLANPATKQRYIAEAESGRDLRTLLRATAMRVPRPRSRLREAIGGAQMVLTDEELADAFVHFPRGQDIDTVVNWAERDEGDRIPPNAY